MPNLRGPELLIIVLIVVLLFGSKRLPEAARSIGRALRIFKAETKGLEESEAVPAETPVETPAELSTGQQARPPVPQVTRATQPAPQAQSLAQA